MPRQIDRPLRGLRTIRFLRWKAGLSQTALAEAVRIPQPTISGYELGQDVSEAHARRLLEFFRSQEPTQPFAQNLSRLDLNAFWGEIQR